MKKFFKYIVWFFLPVVLIMLPFLIGDPYKILRHYERYYPEDGTPMYVNMNRSFVSTRVFLQNKDRLHYDSFIFGSSRSGYFLVEDWQKYIGDSTSCFHYNGYGESLYLVHKKLQLVDTYSTIRHALIPIDEELLKQPDPFTGPIWVTPIELIGHQQFNQFYSEHIRGYLTPKFWLAYTDFMITRQVRPYMMEWGIIDTVRWYNKFESNEGDERLSTLVYPDVRYQPASIEAFTKIQAEARDTFECIIKEPQKMLLEDIKQILEKQHAEYKIVLNPMWDQTKLAQEDMMYLDSLFGNNLFDFSGKTIFTSDYHNYSNAAHFSDRVADKMMEVIYEKDSVRQKQMMDSIYIRM